MGMFDYIRCETELPDGFAGQDFQTKDFDCELAMHIITPKGRLLLMHDRSTPTWRDSNFDGVVNFYTDAKGAWKEYYAEFKGGDLVGITASQEMPMKKEVGETAYEATPAAMPWCLLPREMKSLWRKIECAVLELAAKAIEPKRPRPCDCEGCYCGNPGDTAAVSAWDDATKSAELIRHMKTWGPEE